MCCKPFFDQYLKTDAPKADTPPVFIYNTGENHWDRLKSWPLACEQGCAAPMKPLYLEADFGLGFDKPVGLAERRRIPMSPIPPSRFPIFRARSASPMATAGSNGWSPISARWLTGRMC